MTVHYSGAAIHPSAECGPQFEGFFFFYLEQKQFQLLFESLLGFQLMLGLRRFRRSAMKTPQWDCHIMLLNFTKPGSSMIQSADIRSFAQ